MNECTTWSAKSAGYPIKISCSDNVMITIITLMKTFAVLVAKGERPTLKKSRDTRHDSPNGAAELQAQPAGTAMSRRRLLAYIGAAGAAALAAGASISFANGSAGGETDKLERLLQSGLVVSATIEELRTMTDPNPELVYYVTDKGQEGHFVLDADDKITGDNTGTVVASAAGARFKRLLDAPYLSVKWFGAKGDGENADMIPIQNAIDTASSMGGGTVFFPRGTYIVNPSGRTFISLRDNVNLLGEGTSSIIKIKDNAGDYGMLFSANSGQPLKNVRISHLLIDQNPKGNQTCYIDRERTDSHYWQFVIGLYNYENIVVDNVTFDPTCGINTITLNKVTAKNATITNCRFNFVMAKGNGVYDNSAIYINGRSHTVSNCIFYAAPDQRARGAIETHTGTSVISNNVSDGYYTGINLQSSETSGDHSDMTVTNNTITNANQGIQFGPRFKVPIQNVVIANNTIHLINPIHNRSLTTGISSAGSSEDIGAYDNITITGNTIMFQEELQLRPALTTAAYGIGLYKEADYSNLLISNNVIKNVPVTGIRVGSGTKSGVAKNIQITGNMIVNAGHYPTPHEQFRAGIHLRATVDGAIVSGNYITETYDQTRGMQSIRVNDADGSFTNVTVTGNWVHARQGGLWLNLSPSVTTDAPQVKTLTSFPPANGTFNQGEIVLIAGAAAVSDQTPVGYKVATGGTSGRLNGVTATGENGKPYIVVSDSTLLRPEQWIRIQTGSQLHRIVRISGNEVRLSANLTADVSAPSPISFAAPVFTPFAYGGKPQSGAEESQSAYASLEQEIAMLKEVLRNNGFLS